MPRSLKQLLYRHGWWGAPVVFLLVAGAAILVDLGAPLKIITTFGGALAGVLFFLQKQHLEELALFERLFGDFNRRYDDMNDRLQLVIAHREPLAKEEQALLEDYFNLCAEEYFYFTCGVIDSRVWCAWCRGMLQYLTDPRIADFWRHEQFGESYYGLTRAAIEAGAGLTRTSALRTRLDPAPEERKAA